MISCERAWELLNQQLDESLSPQEAEELEEHLAGCPACRKDREELEQIDRALRGLGEIQAPADFTARVMDQVRQDGRSKPKVIPLRRRPQVRALAGLAACALLCIGIYRLIPQANDLSGGMVASSQQVQSAQTLQPSHGTDQGADNSSGQTDQSQPEEDADGRAPVQPRSAQLQPDPQPAPDQSNAPADKATEQTAPYSSGNGSQEVSQAEEGQEKSQSPQIATVSTQTELVLSGLPDQAAQLLPGLDAWSVDQEGNVSCTVSSQVLEQLCEVLDETGTEYTVSPTPWSDICVVRLG